MKMLALTIFVHNHWGMENWQVKSRPRVDSSVISLNT